MRVIFDCRYTRLVRHDGISRYTAGLVGAFAKLHPVTMLISDERQLAMLPDLPWVKGRAGTSALEPFIGMLSINKWKPDVVFSPMQTMGATGRRYKLVLTVHDMVFYRIRHIPAGYSWYVRAIWRSFYLTYWPQRAVLHRADAVVTGSYNCEREMREARLTSRPLTVIRPGVDDSGLPPREYPASKTLVYMGTFQPNKNVETLARGMNHLPGYTLRLLSRIGDEDRERIAALAPTGSIVFDNGVTDDEYRQALLEATAMVTACRDEGFGIPLIEAEAVGTPLVISDIPLFHEVGGDAAVFFGVDSPESFASAVLGMDNPTDWPLWSARVRQQATEFSWDESARRLLDLLTGLVPEPSEQRELRRR
ncbi:glycosyltransferase family 4 protein [Lacisediminihabitans sp.]|uniref:glycosyltransferase family 4 protein n=1 Tax=Lacisediminihabitans sp. TaxID=2787631 RepID=UPI00374D840E